MTQPSSQSRNLAQRQQEQDKYGLRTAVIREVIAAHGGVNNTARKFGFNHPTVSNWNTGMNFPQFVSLRKLNNAYQKLQNRDLATAQQLQKITQQERNQYGPSTGVIREVIAAHDGVKNAARELGFLEMTVSRWDTGTFPQPHNLRKLKDAYEKLEDRDPAIVQELRTMAQNARQEQQGPSAAVIGENQQAPQPPYQSQTHNPGRGLTPGRPTADSEIDPYTEYANKRLDEIPPAVPVPWRQRQSQSQAQPVAKTSPTRPQHGLEHGGGITGHPNYPTALAEARARSVERREKEQQEQQRGRGD